MGQFVSSKKKANAFLAQFVSSKKKASIMDLTQTTQKPEESANDFIMRWRSLNLQCSEKITEQSAMQIRYNNLMTDIATFVAISETQSFDALVSKASNKNDKKSAKGESLATFVKIEKKNDKGESHPPKRLTLKEHKEVKYSFDDDNVEEIFDQLLVFNAITLPESKRLAEANKTNDPRYCRYHHLISHTLKDCYILKDKIQELLNNGGLEIDSSSRHQSAAANIKEEKLTPTIALLDGAKFSGINTNNGGTIVHACPNVPRSSDLQIPTLHELMAASSLEISEDSSADEFAKGGRNLLKEPSTWLNISHPITDLLLVLVSRFKACRP
ncbi:unnamed protein product [Prunus armeniaca]